MNLHAHTLAVRGAHAPSRASVGALADRNSAKNVFDGAPNTTREGACAPRNEAVALVITLLMLSVITFLAIAFLAMSQRNQSAVSATLDLASAHSMTDAGLARAQSEILAQMQGHGDALYYDYMVSRNYISPSNFDGAEGFYDANNVNYDSFFTNRGSYNSLQYAQLMANLWYDPRPPVFVVTNPALPSSNDFRFWVDINRNGRFETNGVVANIIDELGDTNGRVVVNGEPEFIGVLRNPLYPHSYTNQFIGRYAYLVLPVGKTLDLNYIGNFLKPNYSDFQVPYPVNTGGYNLPDGYARDQGIGSWELNLAGVLDAVSPWAYEFASDNNYNGYLTPSNGYQYNPPNGAKSIANVGNAFNDAQAILHYRYEPPAYSLAPLSQNLSNYLDFENNLIDIFCTTNADGANYPIGSGAYSGLAQKFSWPGSYQTNQFYDVQDLFDPVKTSPYFTNRMILASQRLNTFDRYTFQRLLSSISMGSSPEYGVWVNPDYYGYYSNGFFPQINQQSLLRTKVNLNYDNTAQINSPNAPYAPMPTNLVPWTSLGFFTNAAELLLRSQTFGYTNYLINNTNYYGPPIFAQFGVTNIPIYQLNQPGITYNASIHRMLQLAANIYDATVSTNYQSFNTSLPPVRHPSVFRPVFGVVNPGKTYAGINIVGYVQMTNGGNKLNNLNNLNNSEYLLSQPFYDLSNPNDVSTVLARLASPALAPYINIWGIPWVVGANKGLPQFYQYSYQTSVLYERKLLFVRRNLGGQPDTNHPPQFTNQFYCMCISNNFGMDAWNPYPTPFTGANGATYGYVSNYITVQFTNNAAPPYNSGTTTNIINVYNPPAGSGGILWPGWPNSFNSTNGFVTFLQTNVTTLPPTYYSEYYKQFVLLTNGIFSTNGFRAADTNQTGWPVHNWTLNITNHLVYALFDGVPGAPGTALLDFVNLGPFGNSISIQSNLTQYFTPGNPGGVLGMNGGSTTTANPWLMGNATDLLNSPMSAGTLNQIAVGYTPGTTFYNNLKGVPAGVMGQPFSAGSIFAPPYEPSNVLFQTMQFVANDPIVHYTVGDLILPNQALPTSVNIPVSGLYPYPPLTNTLGKANPQRYFPWGSSDLVGNNMLFKDPQMTASANWNFPTNKFPGIGWLGRVHRGTPWQTVYLKADNPNPSGNLSGGGLGQLWTNWVASPWVGPPYGPEAMPETYPTNDWALVDLFTTAPNDNAARGLLSVNQANDAAWAAVFAGVIAPNSASNGVPISPITDVTNLVDQYSIYGGINALRTNYNYLPNGLFHKVGEILAAPALTTQQPFLITNGIDPRTCSDEIVERIPQQTLSLLKVGEPQFVIFAWGQSLRPKGPPYLGGGLNNNIYTNYEITGEYLTRTLCHVVHTNGLKLVIDSYNVENGSN